MAPQNQHVCVFKIKNFHVYKTLRSSTFSETWIRLPLFFSSKNQNSANMIRNTNFIPSPCISPPLFSQLVYTPPCISATLFSQSPLALYFCFVYGLRSSSCLPGNNSSFLFCWIYVIDLGFLHGGLHDCLNLKSKFWNLFWLRDLLLLMFLFLHGLWIYLGFWLLLRLAYFRFWL